MNVKYWLFAIGLIDLFAVSVIVDLVPVYFKQSGVSPSAYGFYSAIYGTVQFFSSPLVGHWSDKHGKIDVLTICLVLASIAYASTSFALNNFYILVVIRIFLGVFKHTQDLCRNLIAGTNKITSKAASIGQYNAISVIGFVIGPTISGLMSDHFGLELTIRLGYLICAFVFLLNALVVRYILKNAISNEIDYKPSVSKLSLSAEKSISPSNFNWKTNSGMFISRFLVALCVMLYRSSFTLGILHFYPKFTALEIGYFSSYNAFTSFFIGYLCSYAFSHKFYVEQEEKLQLHSHVVISLSFVVIACSNNLLTLLLGLALLVVGTSASKACGVVLPIKRFGNDQAGKALGFNSSVISLARSLAPIIAGLGQEYSYYAPVLISFVISLISLLIFYFTVYLRPVSLDHEKSE